MKRLLRSMVVLLAVACGNPPPNNGFVPRDNPKTTGTLKGQLTSSDGTAIKAGLYLLNPANEIIATGASDETGAFSLDTPLVGRLHLVLNDHKGRGVLQDITMYAAGTNDLGKLTAGALETNPMILSLSGVGYEERRSQHPGDYLSPVYNSAATTVWAARKKAGESKYDIVRLDVATGAETVLVTGADLASGGYSAAVYLLEDKVLWYHTTRLFPGATYNQYIDVAIDAITGQELYATKQDQQSGLMFVAGSALFAIESVDKQFVASGLFGNEYWRSWAVVRVDLASGVTTRSATLPFGYVDGFQFAVHGGTRLVIAPYKTCHYSSAQQPQPPPVCPTDSERYDLSVYRVELASLSVQLSGVVPRTSIGYAPALSPDESTLLAIATSNNVIRLVKLDTTNTTQVPLITAATGQQLELGGLNPAGTQLLVRSTLAGAATISTLDVGSGAATVLPAALNGVTVCVGTCTYAFLPNGDVRLSSVDNTNPQARKALIADFTGASGILRTIPLAQTDGTPDVFRSPDGSKDVVLVRDIVTGFLQAWIGPKGSDFPSMTAATWLTAQHSAPAFSADGLWLNYFTRDPVSGYVQLFRVAATP